MPETARRLPTKYQAQEHEPRILRKWLESGAFHADPGRAEGGGGTRPPYCILIPPPNVTDRLHLGHALNNTLQDVLVRAYRMKGFEALWLPGTDHAGIATQTKVDRQLKEAGEPALADYKRMELEGQGGRETFVAKVQAWKDQFEAEITDQLRLMGCSCDWERQRFTMDPICARAVREAFFRLFRDRLIYRGKRLVNWDPATQTALADDEVEMKEVDGAFFYLRYPLFHGAGEAGVEGGQPATWSDLLSRGYPKAHMPKGGGVGDEDHAFVTVATTRPETYLGDTAVAVNPRDPRAAALSGLVAELPLVGRRIPIIQDEYVVLPSWASGEEGGEGDVKAEMTTGFLKVTPAHDPNDWEIGLRHGLPVINVLAPDASISDQHGWDREARGEDGQIFLGKPGEEARKLVVREFEARGLLEDRKPHRHSVGHSYRSHVAIEPYLSDQWYVKVTDDRLRGFAQRALAADQRTTETYPPHLPTPRAKRAAQGGTGLQTGALLDPEEMPPFRPEGFRGRDPYPPGEKSPRDLMGHIRNLPHIELRDATYFVTWRVARGEILSPDERTAVLDALKHFDGERCRLYAATVMPDHVHCLVRQFEDESLGAWVASVKKFTAREINRRRGIDGPRWQDERLDHVIRDAAWFSRFFQYIVRNPVEAGLVGKPSEYGWTFVHAETLRALGAQRTGLETGATRESTGLETGATRERDCGDGALRFYPERYAKTYELWHDNLRDWCISRQLWWGHRIPVWRVECRFKTEELIAHRKHHVPECPLSESESHQICADSMVSNLIDLFPDKGLSEDDVCVRQGAEGSIFVCPRTDAAADLIERFAQYIKSGRTETDTHFSSVDADGEIVRIEQDPDVLDTWFSSALWPLSTMGWPEPEQSAETAGLLDVFNPTDVLCTAREIITLWVSRMVMFNRYFLGEGEGEARTPGRLPFKDVFIHAMIQDGEGRKMSKSLGNGVDPLDIIHSHGSDAMRFTLCKMTTQTQDVRMPVERDPESGRNTSPKFDEGRNFQTKLWNAARFTMMNLEEAEARSTDAVTFSDLTLADRWMLSRLARTIPEIDSAIAGYQFNVYAQSLYDLLWRDFCDWYLESIKPTVKQSPGQQAVVHQVLDAILRLLHPICPFITEALAEPLHAIPHATIRGLDLTGSATEGRPLCAAGWPRITPELVNDEAERTFARVQALVEAIRQVRTQHQVPPRERLTLHAGPDEIRLIGEGRGIVEAFAGLADGGATEAPPDPGAHPLELRLDGRTLHLTGHEKRVDAGARRAQLEADLAKLTDDIARLTDRLGNPGYTEKAPPTLVQQTRDQLGAKQAERDKLARRLEEL